jgi:hypothetical protein
MDNQNSLLDIKLLISLSNGEVMYIDKPGL